MIQIHAEARFTRDMAETLTGMFQRFECNGVVTIEVSTHGLWLRSPDGGRAFLGLAVLPPAEVSPDPGPLFDPLLLEGTPK